MFDVFYTGPKPEIFPFEQAVKNIEEANDKCKTTWFWLVDGRNNYKNFNWDYRPMPWESEFTHVWPSQWQDSSGTMLVRKDTIEHKWHWHKDVVVKRTSSAPIYYMDFHNPESRLQLELLKEKWQDIKSIRYIGSHLDVFKRIISQCDFDYIWITSSICDYKNFDFTWHPSQWQSEMIHCFGRSTHERYRRGNTFYIHVESFRQQMYDLELLDWFNVIHYNTDQIVYNFPAPKVVYQNDDLISAIKNYKFDWPYVNFVHEAEKDDLLYTEEICLWTEKDRQVVPYSNSHSCCLVPKDVKQYLTTQVYDYPYIHNFDIVVKNSPKMDIVFISNGEPDAERWYQHCVASCKDSTVHRVQNINGRIAAYQAAANISTTNWFFAVFAKLEVDPDFNWSWQPDYWQGPKHYIFHARNPVNGLVYGHQAMIAYNRRLVLSAADSGLDFTLSQPHEVVPILSGVAHYNQDAWTTWRTAFREVVKLKHFQSVSPTVETEYRLKKWLSVANGKFAEWSTQGSKDAVEYYDNVQGNYDDLKLTYEWQWLRNYAANKQYNF